MPKQIRQLSFIFIAIVVVSVVSLRLLPFASDDAYIHFRIAENFAQNGNPYFNSVEFPRFSGHLMACVVKIG